MRVVVLMIVGSVLVAAAGLGMEATTAEQELQITVEESSELTVATPFHSLAASPWEERRYSFDRELTYLTNSASLDNPVKIVVTVEGEPPQWFSMSVEAGNPFGGFAGDSVGEVGLVDQGELADGADLLVNIQAAGSGDVDLTYIIPPAPWGIDAGTEINVTVIYRLLEE